MLTPLENPGNPRCTRVPHAPIRMRCRGHTPTLAPPRIGASELTGPTLALGPALKPVARLPCDGSSRDRSGQPAEGHFDLSLFGVAVPPHQTRPRGRGDLVAAFRQKELPPRARDGRYSGKAAV